MGMHIRLIERNKDIIRLVKEGYKMKYIARIYKVTSQRIQQISSDAGININKAGGLKDQFVSDTFKDAWEDVQNGINRKEYFGKYKKRVSQNCQHMKVIRFILVKGIIQQYNNGLSINDLAKKFGYYRAGIQCILRNNNVIGRDVNISKRNTIIIEQFQSGMTAREVGAIWGLTPTMIQYVLKSKGIYRHPKRRRKKVYAFKKRTV